MRFNTRMQAVNKARAAIYGALSQSFLDPTPEPLDAGVLAGWLRVLPEGESIPLPDPAPRDLSLEIRRVFGFNLSPDCPPYETQYGKQEIFRQSQMLADLSGYYRAFGVDLADGARRPDALTVELEFAGLLCLKEAQADARGEHDHAAVCRSARTRFLRDHLARWSPVFSRAVELKASGTYYASLARTLAAFVELDARALGITEIADAPQEVRREDPDEACSGCPAVSAAMPTGPIRETGGRHE